MRTQQWQIWLVFFFNALFLYQCCEQQSHLGTGKGSAPAPPPRVSCCHLSCPEWGRVCWVAFWQPELRLAPSWRLPCSSALLPKQKAAESWLSGTQAHKVFQRWIEKKWGNKPKIFALLLILAAWCPDLPAVVV